jgi:hypothetical protein
MKNFFKLLFLIAFVVTIQSCSKTNDTTTQQTTTQQQTTTNSGTNTPQTTTGAAQNFQMVNNTGMILVDVFISPNDSEDWGEDVIPKDVIQNGETFDFTFSDVSPDKCIWDIKFTGEDGVAYIMQDINLCKTGVITLTPQN